MEKLDQDNSTDLDIQGLREAFGYNEDANSASSPQAEDNDEDAVVISGVTVNGKAVDFNQYDGKEDTQAEETLDVDSETPDEGFGEGYVEHIRRVKGREERNKNLDELDS